MANSCSAMMASADPGGFMINEIYKLDIFGGVYITTTHISLLLVSILLIGFAVVVNRKLAKAKPEDTPGGLQNVAELIVEMLSNMVKGIMGEDGKRFVNYIMLVFIFILCSNISGLLGLRPPTADYGVTLPLGIITFMLIHVNGIRKHKIGHFRGWLDPIPLFLPINIISDVAVPISLSLRLFGNVLSGTVLMGLIYGMAPVFIRFGIPSVLHVYFDLFAGAIQTYVFSMLTMVYVSSAISD